MPKIVLDLNRCVSWTHNIMCPHCEEIKPPENGFGFDYRCKAKGCKKIVLNAEHEYDIPDVPIWCPCLLHKPEDVCLGENI